MKTKFVIGALLLASLSGCGSTGVLDRERPDEFAVTKAPPLAVPADLSILPTPQPGVQKPAADTKQDVLDAMFGAPKQ
jgi:uncharacterized lipoprotein